MDRPAPEIVKPVRGPLSPALVQLLVDNRTGKLAHLAKGGFRCSAHPDVKYQGLTTTLASRFPHLSRKEYQEGKAREDPGGDGPKHSRPSNVVIGTQFHAHVMHTLICKQLRDCVCPRSPGPSSPWVDNMVIGARRAMASLGLQALCGEVVIISKLCAVGTRCDMIAARDGHPEQLVLVSWKTCGECPFVKGVKEAPLGEVLLNPSSTGVSCTQDYVAQTHLAQVACELYMLWDTHGLKEVRSAVIIYLFPGTTLYRCVWLSSEHCNAPICQLVTRVVTNTW